MFLRASGSTYSKPWLGRPFVLAESSLSWGRYTVELSSDSRDPAAHSTLGQILRGGALVKSADVFKNMLNVSMPDDLPNYLLEVHALAKYYTAKQHVKALVGAQFTRLHYEQGREAMAAAFQGALSAVFEAALPLHGLATARFARYRQVLHGSHLATFSDAGQSYDAAFTPDLVLECITRDSDGVRVWPVQSQAFSERHSASI